MSEITIGCDPEVFVKQNGKFVSAYGLIPGNKEHPHSVANGAVQVDGMALEFNIIPSNTNDYFVYRVDQVLKVLKQMIPKDHEIVITPVAHFDEEYLKQQPKEALELGCDPDYNGWTGIVNERPNATKPMRTASGHIHVGWINPYETDNYDENADSTLHQHRCKLAGQQLDFFLGLPSLFYDEDTERREMYGKAGAIRYKNYGVEYRTLSNMWLKSDTLKKWVFNNTLEGMDKLMNGVQLSKKYGDIQEIINTSDKKEAEKIIKAENIKVCYG